MSDAAKGRVQSQTQKLVLKVLVVLRQFYGLAGAGIRVSPRCLVPSDRITGGLKSLGFLGCSVTVSTELSGPP